jgi:predicted N-acetyltransferase YhbS
VSVNELSIRALAEADLPLIAQIDRSEVIRVGYESRGGALTQIEVQWDAPGFFGEGEGEHTVSGQIAFCKRHLQARATALGAFDGDKLVGIGLLTPEIRPGLAQLAYLQVSSPYRRRGIGAAMTSNLLSLARKQGARRVYVSATPSQSAVEFYQSFGFVITRDPLPELYALEPEDIHMILDLESAKEIGSA